ncbi:hypothetical protein B0H14DRAFT_2579867 [Mycena olivaceomarginata]|nr:hypothetical protein B0H14DRAFT_2579867 [Mycena olivaceomarginata]
MRFEGQNVRTPLVGLYLASLGALDGRRVLGAQAVAMRWVWVRGRDAVGDASWPVGMGGRCTMERKSGWVATSPGVGVGVAAGSVAVPNGSRQERVLSMSGAGAGEASVARGSTWAKNLYVRAGPADQLGCKEESVGKEQMLFGKLKKWVRR